MAWPFKRKPALPAIETLVVPPGSTLVIRPTRDISNDGLGKLARLCEEIAQKNSAIRAVVYIDPEWQAFVIGAAE